MLRDQKGFREEEIECGILHRDFAYVFSERKAAISVELNITLQRQRMPKKQSWRLHLTPTVFTLTLRAWKYN